MIILEIAHTCVPLCALACKDHANSGPTRVACGPECRRVKCSDYCVDAFGDGNRVCCNPLRHHVSGLSNLSEKIYGKKAIGRDERGEKVSTLRTGNLLRR